MVEATKAPKFRFELFNAIYYHTSRGLHLDLAALYKQLLFRLVEGVHALTAAPSFVSPSSEAMVGSLERSTRERRPGL